MFPSWSKALQDQWDPSATEEPFCCPFPGVCVFYCLPGAPHAWCVSHLPKCSCQRSFQDENITSAPQAWVFHQEYTQGAGQCSSSPLLPAVPRFGCGLCSRISLTWKTPPGSGKPKGNLGDGTSWMWGKKNPQRAALDAEWWECHRIFLGSLIPSSESKEETRNLGLQECECRRVYTGNNPRVVVEGSR